MAQFRLFSALVFESGVHVRDRNIDGQTGGRTEGRKRNAAC